MLENDGSSGVAKNDVWRMLCAEPVALDNKLRIAGRQRTQDRRQCGLSASVFGINQGERRQRCLRRRANIVEHPDISE